MTDEQRQRAQASGELEGKGITYPEGFVPKFDATLWIEHGESILTETPVMPLEVFEAMILNQFPADVERMKEAKLKGKRRTRAENLTDHIKASLTRRNCTRYMKARETTYIVYQPEIGEIEGIGAIYDNRIWKVIETALRIEP